MSDIYSKMPRSVKSLALQTVQHGGQIYQFARQKSLPLPDALYKVLDFSASINPVRPAVDWRGIEQQVALALGHYPDGQQVALKSAIAARFALNSEQITLTNGISSAILSLFGGLKPDKTLLFTPIYSEYQRAAALYSHEVIECSYLPSCADCQPDALSSLFNVLDGLTSNSVVVLVNPSTPLGHFISPELLWEWLSVLQAKQCWVLVDESFLPFIGFDNKYSLRSKINSMPRLVILQSLTKFYACPGVRVGALFSAANALDALPWPAWPVSILDEQYLLQALNDPLHAQKTYDFFESERDAFVQALAKCPQIASVQTSSVNFVLARCHYKAQLLVAQLAKHHILIRDCQSFGLGAYYCRIAIRSRVDNCTLINTLCLLGANNAV